MITNKELNSIKEGVSRHTGASVSIKMTIKTTPSGDTESDIFVTLTKGGVAGLGLAKVTGDISQQDVYSAADEATECLTKNIESALAEFCA